MKEKNGEHPLGDGGQILALVVFLLVWIGDSFFLRLSTISIGWAPLPIRLALSGVIFLAALYLIRSGHIVVRHEERPNTVVDGGAFGLVRHPLYLGCLLTYLALLISTLSLASLVISIGIFGFYDFIAGYEEKLLENKFGMAYHTYMENTGKWLPRIRKNS